MKTIKLSPYSASLILAMAVYNLPAVAGGFAPIFLIPDLKPHNPTVKVSVDKPTNDDSNGTVFYVPSNEEIKPSSFCTPIKGSSRSEITCKFENAIYAIEPLRNSYHNSDGQLVNTEYDLVFSLSEERVRTKHDGKYGFLSESDATVAIPFRYQYANSFSEGLASVSLGGKDGYINKKGDWVVEPIYDLTKPFSEQLAVVKKNDKFGYINHDGNVVIPLKYDKASSFSEGLAGVSFNGEFGFINKKGNSVIDYQYKSVGSFSEGLTNVETNNGRTYIDKKGKSISPYTFSYTGAFKDGLSQVKNDGRYGYINKTGDIVIDMVYDYIYPFDENDKTHVKIAGKHGIINKKGEVIVPIEYEFAHVFDDEFLVYQSGKSFYLDAQGKPIKEEGLCYKMAKIDSKTNNIPWVKSAYSCDKLIPKS